MVLPDQIVDNTTVLDRVFAIGSHVHRRMPVVDPRVMIMTAILLLFSDFRSTPHRRRRRDITSSERAVVVVVPPPVGRT